MGAKREKINMLWSKTPPTRKSYSHDSESHSKITPAPKKWGSRMVKNGCLYSDLSFQRVLMILVSKFLYSYVVSKTIIKKINMLWSKTPPPYPDLNFQPILIILVSKFLYSCLVSITIIKMLKMIDQKGQK